MLGHVILAFGLITLVVGQYDTSVCTIDGTTPPPGISGQNVIKPNIANQFHTRIEVVLVNKNQTQIFHEYFDAVNNRGFMDQQTDNLNFAAWYNYGTNQFIQLVRGVPVNTPGACTVTDLSNSDQRYLLGYEVVNGQGTIFSAAGALHWSGNNINEVYMGKTTVRDISVDWWRSCQYWSGMGATMVVDWYFSARGANWTSSTGADAVPVQCHVKGKAAKNGISHDFEHYYNFFDYQPTISADETQVFETPRGVVCPGKKLVQPFPAVPNDAFSFTTEILDQAGQHISFMKETFFYTQKLVKFEYRPQQGDYAPYGLNDLIEIHDFHSGVAYITDRLRGNCTARPIETSQFDNKASGANNVRIRSSSEFFYFDVSKQSTSYEGVKKNRNIDCDTWVATRSDFPFTFPSNSTWEWYFATNNWSYPSAGPELGAIPVQMRISIPDRGWNYQYNIYDFKKDKPNILHFDISGCYRPEQTRKFQFMLNVTSDAMTAITSNMNAFKYYVLEAITMVTGINPIRVAHLNVYVVDVIIVTFELLDKSPVVGDVQRASDYQEVELDFAADTLASTISNGNFVVNLGGDQFSNIGPLVALPNSIVEITYMNQTTTTIQSQMQTGYGPGPMAAVGVTMPLLGAGLGVVFAYFFFK